MPARIARAASARTAGTALILLPIAGSHKKQRGKRGGEDLHRFSASKIYGTTWKFFIAHSTRAKRAKKMVTFGAD